MSQLEVKKVTIYVGKKIDEKIIANSISLIKAKRVSSLLKKKS